MTDKASYIQLSCEAAEEWHDILVAILAGYGFEGFEDQNGRLVGYVLESAFNRDEVIHTLSGFDFVQIMEVEIIEPKNWNQLWESNYPPIAVENFCYVRALFHEAPLEDTYDYDLLIHPQMSFGTGHHETTQLMLRLMKHIPMAKSIVLDMGCGTGILGILSSKMGAAKVVGIDISPWSSENAAENIALNQIENMSLALGGTEQIPDQLFDIILANINLNVLKNDIPTYVKHLKERGKLVLSGFYDRDLAELKEVLKKVNLNVRDLASQGEWVAILASR